MSQAARRPNFASADDWIAAEIAELQKDYKAAVGRLAEAERMVESAGDRMVEIAAMIEELERLRGRSGVKTP